MIQDVLMLMGKLTKALDSDCLLSALIMGFFSLFIFFECFSQLHLDFHLHENQTIVPCC